MAKELVVSSAGHETKVAILEDNQVVETYFERKREYSLAGSIYKGRVTRVLPGMQSAFVEIGLERDAFLYVSDFFEDLEEYDKIVTSVEDKVSKMEEVRMAGTGTSEPPTPKAKSEAPAVSESPSPETAGSPGKSAAPERERGSYPPSRRGRHRRSRRRGFPDSKYSRRKGPSPKGEASSSADASPAPTILPGESLAKYRSMQVPSEGDSSGEKTVEAAALQPDVAETSSLAGETPEAVQEPRAELAEPEAATPPTPEQDVAFEPSTVSSASEDSNVGETEAAQEPRAELTEPEAATPSTPEQDVAFEPSTVSPVSEDSNVGETEAARETTETDPSGIESEAVSEEAGAEGFAAAGASSEEAPTVAEPGKELVAEDVALEPQREASEEKDGDGTLESKQTPLPESSQESTEESVSAEVGPSDRPQEVASAKEASAGSAGNETALQEQSSEQSSRQTKAVVRNGPRNPRYQRRSRWAARRDASGGGYSRRRRPGEQPAPSPQISDLLKEGQEIIVQIAKEPLGKKGARITSHIALPGRYLVYMPTVNHVGVSHKISSDKERLRLKRIIQEHSRNIPGGFIVRTAGEGRSEEELRQDILFLADMWSGVREEAEKSKAPALLHHDLDLVQRIVRDQLSEDFTAVWTDTEQEYEKLVNWVGRFQPSLVGRVKLYTKDVPLFEQMGIQEEINKALKPKVWLKSGGYIVINQTEALVAIDVNTGKFVGLSSRLEDTIVKTNVDAIQEIVRQIRLRDLGGIIVVDFIDMDERKNRHKVMAALEEALRADRSPSKILAFNEFGLVAITRKRVRQSLERTLGQPCPHCSGSGFVKSAFTVCSEIDTEARKMASELEGRQVTLRVNPEVGKTLKSRNNAILSDMEEMLGKPVVVRNDPGLHIENFAFE